MTGKVGLTTADTRILPMIYHALVKAVLLGAIGTTQS